MLLEKTPIAMDELETQFAMELPDRETLKVTIVLLSGDTVMLNNVANCTQMQAIQAALLALFGNSQYQKCINN